MRVKKKVEDMSIPEDRKGRCYELNWQAIFESTHPFGTATVYLVHGAPILQEGPNKGKRYGHAWLECAGWVYDAVAEKKLPIELYYLAGQIDPELNDYYTRQQAMVEAVAKGHYGPWEEHDGVFYGPEHKGDD